MPSLVTSLVVAALAALFGVATLDAVQGGGEESSAGPPRTVPFEKAATRAALGRSDATRALRNGSANGELVYTVEACRTVALRLPDLEQRTLGGESPCPTRSADNGWRRLEDGASLRRELVREALWASGRISIREIAQLGPTRLAAIVRDHGRGLDFVAVFEAGRLVARPSLADSSLSGIGVSPKRQHIAVRTDSGGIYVLDRAGRFALPGRYRFGLLDVRAVAWSPDDKWTALAARRRLYLLETRPSARHVIDLPVSAIALDWR